MTDMNPSASKKVVLNKHAHVKPDVSQIVIRVISYVLIGVTAICCILPFWLIISASFTAEDEILRVGFSLWPNEWNVEAYKILLRHPEQVLNSYALTIVLTVLGTFLGVWMSSMTGYVLQRPDFAYRNGIMFYIYFTTLFGGGLIPWYVLIVMVLQWKDNYLAILLPAVASSWNILLFKNFTKAIPHEVTESALIDGATDFTIYLKIILPMSAPALATIGLFIALGYWNEWYSSMLFLSANTKNKPLQLFLYNTINMADSIKNTAAADNVTIQDVPSNGMKMATAVLTTGPIIFVYPAVQKYFISGITIGAVKG